MTLQRPNIRPGIRKGNRPFKRRRVVVAAPPAGDSLLLESGDFMLLESGDQILLE